MKLTPSELRAGEDAIFNALEHGHHDRTFLGRLYRDGVPTPESYLAQRVRVVFVFREPNMRGKAHAHDMRDEVSDEFFRPRGPDGMRGKSSTKGWWNRKAGMFAHAVAAALKEEGCTEAFAAFHKGGWNHEVVNRFAYIQIKKVGGSGTSTNDVGAHAAKYAATLRHQVDLYQPHLVLGCGVGRNSPARLLAAHVLVGGRAAVTEQTGANWWEFAAAARPRAMVQLWHPAKRGLRSELYQDVWTSVREVVHKIGFR